MLKCIIAVVVTLAIASCAFCAEEMVQIKLELARNTVKLGDPVMARLTMTNVSAGPLKIWTLPADLECLTYTFNITDEQGQAPPMLVQPPSPNEQTTKLGYTAFEFQPGKGRTCECDIYQRYALSPGKTYRIVARRDYGLQLESHYSAVSEPVTLTVTGPADSVEPLRRVLFAARDLQSLNSDKAGTDAIDQLVKIGSPDAVRVLADFLRAENKDAKLKQKALAGLGIIGSDEAIKAITEWEKWTRSAYPPPFRIGPATAGIDHFGSSSSTPVAQVTDKNGTTWVVFLWYRFGFNDNLPLWLTSSKSKDKWTEPAYLDAPNDLLKKDPDKGIWSGRTFKLETDGSALVLTIDDQKLRIDPAERMLDSDKDGLYDSTEKHYGTDPGNRDSDKDGVPDGSDSNPLTPKRAYSDDISAIRQAAFQALFATSSSRDAVAVVEDKNGSHFADQEYYGYWGPLLKASAIRRGFINLTSIELQKASDTEATASISDWEGELAASGHEVKLKKVHGKWVVTSINMTWIS